MGTAHVKCPWNLLKYIQSWSEILAPLRFCQIIHNFSQIIGPITNSLVFTCLFILFAKSKKWTANIFDRACIYIFLAMYSLKSQNRITPLTHVFNIVQSTWMHWLHIIWIYLFLLRGGIHYPMQLYINDIHCISKIWAGGGALLFFTLVILMGKLLI